MAKKLLRSSRWLGFARDDVHTMRELDGQVSAIQVDLAATVSRLDNLTVGVVVIEDKLETLARSLGRLREIADRHNEK